MVRKQLANSEDSELRELLQRMESEVRRLDRQLHALLSVSVPPPADIRADPPCAVVSAEG